MSTYSTNLKIELIGTGEQAGTWGVTTDDNFSNVFEQSIVGRVTVPFSDADVTLTATNSVSSQSFRNVYLNCTGTNTASKNLIVPTINKNYVVQNNTTGGFSIVVKTTAGTGITVPNGKTCTVYADGTNVIQAFDYLPTATLGSPLITTSGGTGLSSYTAGDLTYYASGTALSKLAIGTNGYILKSTGSAPTWVDPTTIIGGAGGSNTQIQYNSSGLLAGSANMTFDGSTLTTLNTAYTGTLTGGTGVVNLGSGQFYKDASGNIGVGTTTFGGSGKFQVGGGRSYFGSNDSVFAVNVSYNNTRALVGQGYYLGGTNSATPDLVFSNTDGTEKVRIDYSGNVGIGVIPKTWSQGRAIEVGNNGTALWNSSTQDNNSLICNAYYNSGFLFAGTGYASRYQQNSGVHSWQTSSASGTAGGAITFNTSMTIDASGNVGIGTTSTGGAKLYVNGYANSNTSWVVTKDGSDTIGSGPSFQLQNAAGTRSWVTQLGGSNSYDWWYFNGSAWAQQMRIDSSGRLLIGTTNSNPIVNRANGQVFSPNGSFTRRQPVSTSDWAVDANSGSIVNFYSDGGSYVYAGSISVTSNITTYGSVSDYRLKENIVPLSGALEKVSKLNPVSYSFKNNGQKSEGFIAHELQAIIPDAVTGTKDAVKIQSYEISPAIPAEIDENGKIVKEAVEAVMGEREVPDYQGVDTSFLIATLTAAIQELNAKVTALEAKVG